MFKKKTSFLVSTLNFRGAGVIPLYFDVQGCCGKGQEAGKGPGISDHFGGGVCVGHVIGPFGFRGMLFVVPGGVDPMFFFSLEQLFHGGPIVNPRA